MCATSPYGGEEIFYPHTTTDHSLATISAGIEFLDSDANKVLLISNYDIPATTVTTYLSGKSTPKGTVFVLTFVCSYQFSSAFVKMLFSGGSNTKIAGGAKGTLYLLWGRGIGIVN
jgi:hypothetical protein